MSATLTPCPSCGRHTRAGEARCPFCAAALAAGPRPRALRGLALSAGASLAALSLQACYGAPPMELRPEQEREAVRAQEDGVSPTTSESNGR